jgi:uncharacterized membrane protein YfcA
MTIFGAIDPLYCLTGFAVGALVGMTGVGGGSLMTPVLVLLFGIHPAMAVGTDLLYAAITKSGGTLVHGLSRTVDWRITLRLALGSVPAAIVTLIAAGHFGLLGASGGSVLVSTVLGVALILTAIALIFRTRLLEIAASRLVELDPRQVSLLTSLTGVVLGVLVSLSSVGAGALGITALIFLYPRLPTARIVGSDLAHAVPLTLVAGLVHWRLGSVDWLLLGSLLVGSLPGITLGSFVSARVPEKLLRPVLAATLLLVGGKLAF